MVSRFGSEAHRVRGRRLGFVVDELGVDGSPAVSDRPGFGRAQRWTKCHIALEGDARFADRVLSQGAGVGIGFSCED